MNKGKSFEEVSQFPENYFNQQTETKQNIKTKICFLIKYLKLFLFKTPPNNFSKSLINS